MRSHEAFVQDGRVWPAKTPFHQVIPRLLQKAVYSALNVIAGSTRAARHAGTQHAMTDTPISSAIIPRYVVGSRGDTLNSKVMRARLAATAPLSPIRTPRPVSVIAWRNIRARILPRVAPSADRTPISRIRSVTLPDRTP